MRAFPPSTRRPWRRTRKTVAHPFRDEARETLAGVFGSFGSTDGLAADARYTPAGGGSDVDLRAMPDTADAPLDMFGKAVMQTGRRFALLKDDVADRPERGATIALLGDAGDVAETFTVIEAAMSFDRFQLVWICVTGEPS